MHCDGSNRFIVDIFFFREWWSHNCVYKLLQSYSSIAVNSKILEHKRKEIMAISLLRSYWEVVISNIDVFFFSL